MAKRIFSDVLFDKEYHDHLMVDITENTNVLISGLSVIGKKEVTKEQLKRLVKRYIPTSMYLASRKHPTFSVTPYTPYSFTMDDFTI